jgi:dihydroxyacetone kinase-like predicted kinase
MHIDGKRLVEILSSGASKLVGHQQYLDSINYYPVPDADTGTNMHKTMMPLSINQGSFYHSSWTHSIYSLQGNHATDCFSIGV